MAIPPELWAILGALLLGLIIGSIPLGHLLWGWFGREDLRRLPSYLVGVPALWRRAGPVYAVVVAAVDAGKGLVAVALAAQLPLLDNVWLPVAALGVLLGHFYPLPARWLFAGPLPRGRGAFVAVGALVGLGLLGSISGWVPGLSLLLWAVAVLAPYGLRRGHGYVALGNVLAAVAAPVTAYGLGHNPRTTIILALMAGLILWRHKANLARMVEGMELGALESRPLPHQTDEITCAFLIHRMSTEDWWQMRLLAWLKPLAEAGWLSLDRLERVALSLQPMQLDNIDGIVTPDGRKVRVLLLGIPLSADQILGHPELAVKRAVAAARLAEGMGAQTFGLGAFWSVIGDKGLKVQEKVSVPVTNGGAYTAATVKTGLEEALALLATRGRTASDCTAAVVGAAGVVGFGMARALAGHVRELIMVGRNRERLERMAERLARRNPDTAIRTVTDLAAIKDADVIFTATSQPEAVIFPEHVAPDTLIYDLGRPADVDTAVAAVPGVVVIPGGVVRPPGQMLSRLDLHFGDGLIPACLAETIILALTGQHQHRSLGDRTKTASIAFFATESVRLGFQVIGGTKEPMAAAPI